MLQTFGNQTLLATFSDIKTDDKSRILKTLETVGAKDQAVSVLTNIKNHIAVVFHDGCPDGSWSGEVVSRFFRERDIVALSQKYPTETPDKMVGLLKLHKAISDDATSDDGMSSVLMTADTLFDIPLVLKLLELKENITIINNDHHGGSGIKFLHEYDNLDQEEKSIIDKAMEEGKLIVAIDTEESGASQTLKLLSESKLADDDLEKVFGCSDDKELACYTQFMRAWDLTTMQPGAVKEFTDWAGKNVILNAEVEESLQKVSKGIENKFIRDNILHYALAYKGDNQFNAKYHFHKPINSDKDKVVAPSHYDKNDVSYSGTELPRGVLMKRTIATKEFVAGIFDQFKDFNVAMKGFDANGFIGAVNNLSKYAGQGKKVQYNGETFLAINAESRAGRFVQAVASDKLVNHPDCQYAVLFKNKFNVSLMRGVETKLDLTRTVKAWQEKGMIKSGGGHPEAVGMQLTEGDQYKLLLEKCSEAGITLNDNQKETLSK